MKKSSGYNFKILYLCMLLGLTYRLCGVLKTQKRIAMWKKAIEEKTSIKILLISQSL